MVNVAKESSMYVISLTLLLLPIDAIIFTRLRYIRTEIVERESEQKILSHTDVDVANLPFNLYTFVRHPYLCL